MNAVATLRHSSVLSLATSPAVVEGRVDDAARVLTELASIAMNVARSSVWLFGQSGSELRCVDLFDRREGQHLPMGDLATDDFPRYIAALRTNLAIPAADVFADSRTNELEPYLSSHGIGAMLDSGIRRKGEIAGVVCFEHVGGPRAWLADEIAFGAALADQIGIAIGNAELRRSLALHETSEKRLRVVLENIPDLYVAADREGRIVFVNHPFGSRSTADLESTNLVDWQAATEQPRFRAAVKGALTGFGSTIESAGWGDSGRWYTNRIFPLVEAGSITGVQIIAEEITGAQRIERLLIATAQECFGLSGEALIKTLVRRIAQTTNSDYALIGELIRDDSACRTLAVWADGKPAANFEYPLDGTPSETIVRMGTCSYPGDLQQTFPEDTMLVGMGAQACVGVPLWDSTARAIGLLSVHYRSRIEDAPLVASTLLLLSSQLSAALEHMRAERALRTSETRFRRLTESGIIGIVVADLEGNVSDANDAFLSMVGYSRDDLRAGRVSGTTLNTPDSERTDAPARVQLQTVGIAQPREKELIRKDGTRVPILSGVVMTERTAGECVGFVLDLTERKRAEARLRESDARKTAVMEAALDAIVLMDHEGTITEVNAAAEHTFGYSRDEIVGKSLADMIVPPSLRDRHRDGLKRYLETGETHVLGTRMEVPALRKDGTEFPAEVGIVRIDSEGTPAFTGYIRDITERRQAAESALLRKAKEAAEAANAELEAFSYSVAHDLRAPLRGMSGFSAMLLEDYGDTLDLKGKEHVERITACVKRMSQIIDALLSLARLSRREARREPVDLTATAHKVIAQLRANEPERVVDFVVAEGLNAWGDPDLLRGVLENLLGNAWKFTCKTAAPRIELGCELTGSGTAYYVRDNGAGFDMAQADRLFKPFRRLHAASDFEGTGIGLATVQRIVHRHAGQIWAAGAENRGATFHFTLSAREPQPEGESQAQPA